MTHCRSPATRTKQLTPLFHPRTEDEETRAKLEARNTSAESIAAMTDEEGRTLAENAEPQPPARKGLLGRALEELGLVSLYHSSRDVKVLYVQRFMRMFAYGSSTLVLVSYLEALAITKTQIGVFMTLTLAGDVCISFVLTMFADGVGRKATLALGAVLMAASGVVFASFGNYWLLLAAAVFGVITPR